MNHDYTVIINYLLYSIIFIELSLIFLYFFVNIFKSIRPFIITFLFILFITILYNLCKISHYLKIIICDILIISIFNISLIYIYNYVKNKKSIYNNYDYRLIKLCKKNINIKYNSYDIKENIFQHKFNSKKEYIEYLIELLTLIKQANYEQISFIISFHSILMSISSLIISLISIVFDKESDNITLIIILILLAISVSLIRIRTLLPKMEINSYLKIHNFEKYLNNLLDEISNDNSKLNDKPQLKLIGFGGSNNETKKVNQEQANLNIDNVNIEDNDL